jgi:hypothetical protein
MKRVFASIAVLLVASACAGEPEGAAVPSPTSSPPATNSPAPPVTRTPTTAPTIEAFAGSVAVIDAATRSRMTSSWRAGCPVPLEDLRILRLRHWGFDGKAHTGELVVHDDHAEEVLGVFEALFDARFPIRRMMLVDVYGGDDDRSMAANNTSAFNCRRSASGSGDWSQHAFGNAVDINPIQNPYVSGGNVEPPAGERYADRSLRAAGMIQANDAVVKAFARIGWEWGGDWTSSKDYQHFSSNGR